MKLIVFDLDFTLWDAGGSWCDETNPPYRKVQDFIVDAMGKKIKLYPDTIDILQELHQKGHTLSVASRTTAPAIAQELLKHFAIDQYFKHSQIYPGSKTIHFQNLRNLTGREFSSMLFFDDELRNIAEVSAMGVKSILVEKGITKALVNKSLILN